MNYRKMRSIMNLFESISDDPAVNDLIEKKLEEAPPESREKVTDLLDIICMAGSAGVSAKEWADRFRAIWPKTEAPTDVAEYLKLTMKLFGKILISKGADNRYHYSESVYDHEPDVPEHVRQGISSMVNLTSDLLAKAKSLGEFHLGSLVRVVISMGLPDPMATEQVMHFINTFPTMIKHVGGDLYKYVEEKKRSFLDPDELYNSAMKDISSGKFSEDEE